MANTNPAIPSMSMRSIHVKDKSIWTNFFDWHCNLRGHNQGKGNGKTVVKTSKIDAFVAPRPRPKPQEPKPPRKENVIAERKLDIERGIVFFYLKELKKNKGSVPSTSSIFVIEINLSISNPTSWVLDTGCGAYICGNLQGLWSSRTLAKGEVDLQVENGTKVVTLAIETNDLTLRSRPFLELNNYYAISKNIILISCLDLNGFRFVIKNNNISISKEDVFYENGYLMNGLYILNNHLITSLPITLILRNLNKMIWIWLIFGIVV